MAGAVACNLFLITKEGANSDPLLVLVMANNEANNQYVKWELCVFLLMGIGFGYLAYYYLQLHQLTRNVLLRYNDNYPLVTAAVVAVVTALFVYVSGAFTADSVGVISMVSDVFNKGAVSEMAAFSVDPMGGLFASFLVRVFLTLLGTNIVVPAGIFMPMILIGGLLGRFCGHAMYGMGYHAANIPDYALVGAVAFASGITHTISAVS
jgi:H+/Cl- antiporter ClcA